MKLDLSNPAWQQTLPPGRSVAGDAPVAACAFSKDGSTVAFALGDGRVRLLAADINAAETAAAEPLHSGVVLALIGDSVEKVRGERVSFRVMERASAIGFVLVIMLFFLGLSNDIGRLGGEGFEVR